LNAASLGVKRPDSGDFCSTTERANPQKPQNPQNAHGPRAGGCELAWWLAGGGGEGGLRSQDSSPQRLPTYYFPRSEVDRMNGGTQRNAAEPRRPQKERSRTRRTETTNNDRRTTQWSREKGVKTPKLRSSENSENSATPKLQKLRNSATPKTPTIVEKSTHNS